MNRQRNRGSNWFTVADDASRDDVALVSRAVLEVVRNRITYFGIDAVSDRPWPDDVKWAVDRLDQGRHSADRRLLGFIRLQPSITAELDLSDAGDYKVAAATVPLTIGCTGLDAQSRPIFSMDDTGTGAAFRLTPGEADAAKRGIEAAGGDANALILMP